MASSHIHSDLLFKIFMDMSVIIFTLLLMVVSTSIAKRQGGWLHSGRVAPATKKLINFGHGLILGREYNVGSHKKLYRRPPRAALWSVVDKKLVADRGALHTCCTKR